MFDFSRRTWDISSISKGRRSVAGVSHRRGEPTFELAGETYSYFRHPYNVNVVERAARRYRSFAGYLPESETRERSRSETCSLITTRPWVTLSSIDTSGPVVRALSPRTQRPFRRVRLYDLIVSISTLEHVGHDEVPREEEKILRTMLHLRSLLSARFACLHGPDRLQPPARQDRRRRRRLPRTVVHAASQRKERVGRSRLVGCPRDVIP